MTEQNLHVIYIIPAKLWLFTVRICANVSHNGKALLIKVWEALRHSTPLIIWETQSKFLHSEGLYWMPFHLWCPCVGFLINQGLHSVQAYCVSQEKWLSCILQLWLWNGISFPVRRFVSFIHHIGCMLTLYSTASFLQQSKTGLTVLRLLKGLFSSASHPISSKYRQWYLGLCSWWYAVA